MSSNPSSTSNDAKPSHEQIAVRAELLWKAKGSPDGRDEEIWLEAERQLYDEAREIIGSSSASPSSSKQSSEDPNPSMGQKSSAAEEMTPPPAATPRGSRRRSNGK